MLVGSGLTFRTYEMQEHRCVFSFFFYRVTLGLPVSQDMFRYRTQHGANAAPTECAACRDSLKI